uniref:Delta(24)-sterol reductase n=1 Tax=Cacopsylla melanoneura TaxID=428564 RepID=A0A8D9A8C8_9HEMI
MASEAFLEHVLKKYRWVIVIFILLPLTFLYDIYYYVRQQVIQYLKESSQDHQEKVKHVQSQVRDWIKTDQSKPMCTGRAGWKSMTLREPKYKSSMYPVDLEEMDTILSIDEEKRTVKVEPYVTMGQLTRYLLPKGWSIPVVVELDDVTVGGIVLGQGLESSSHKYGMFHNNCISYELVLSDGSLVTCSKDKESDLFHVIPWSYGTLGFLTAIEIQIIPVKKYVQLQYVTLKTLPDLEHHLKKESENKANDFVEAILFSKDQSVLMIGTLSDTPDPSKTNPIGRWYQPWFFEHVRSFLTKKKIVEEYIPILDYYHRYTKALFWEIRDIVPFGNHPLFRLLLGWLMPPKVSLLKLTQTQTIKNLYDKHHVVEDYLVPMTQLRAIVDYFHDNIEVYPVWICPFLLKDLPGLVHPEKSEDTLYVDLGLYGEPKADGYHSKKTISALENYLGKIRGFQMLYAGVYQSKEQFRENYDHRLYDRVRTKLDCNKAFPEIYDKVNRVVRD